MEEMRGFTLIELLVSVGIFAMMTALLVSKYGNFNQSVLLTNLAYDVALTLRTAQTYGVSIRGQGTGDASFLYGYGVHISDQAGENQRLTFFATPTIVDDVYDGKNVDGDLEISRYAIKRGARVSDVCAGTEANCQNVAINLDITFKRPDPNAVICIGAAPPSMECNKEFAKITLEGTDGSLRHVTIRKNGQISVEN
jgi:prepilin-type N-terminal cleavage/methylation domain-containing protein